MLFLTIFLNLGYFAHDKAPWFHSWNSPIKRIVRKIPLNKIQ